MTLKLDLLGRLELQVVLDTETQQRKIVFRNQRGELLDPAYNPELMATLSAGGITQADLSAALATKANASSLAAKVDTVALNAAISTQHTVDNGTYAPRLLPPQGRTGAGRRWLVAPTVVTRFQSGHGWTLTPAGGTTLGADTSDSALGSQSVQCTTDGAGSYGVVYKSGLTIDMTGKHFRIMCKVSDLSKVAEFTMWAITTAGNEYFFDVIDTGTNTLKWLIAGNWAWIDVPWKPKGTNGTPNRASITALKFQLKDRANGSIKFGLNGIDTMANAATLYPKGVVSLTFDDSYLSQYTLAKPTMDAYGYSGTGYQIVETITGGNALTLAQLHYLEDRSGWEIGGHAFTLANHAAGWGNLSDQQVQDDVLKTREWLRLNGFQAVDQFAYPGGNYSATTLPIARTNFQSARGIYTVNNGAECLPPADYMRVRSIATSAGQIAVKALIDNAYAEGGWAVLYAHDIISGGTTGGNITSLTDWQAMIDYVAAKGDMPVLTVGQVVNSLR